MTYGITECEIRNKYDHRLRTELGQRKDNWEKMKRKRKRKRKKRKKHLLRNKYKNE